MPFVTKCFSMKLFPGQSPLNPGSAANGRGVAKRSNARRPGEYVKARRASVTAAMLEGNGRGYRCSQSVPRDERYRRSEVKFVGEASDDATIAHPLPVNETGCERGDDCFREPGSASIITAMGAARYALSPEL
jgi:hypothetical protein